jgi:uncharacterized membrane protein
MSEPLPAQPVPASQSNELAKTSFVLGVVGLVFGLVTLGFIALICGPFAVVFGFVGRRKAKAGAEHGRRALWGMILGVLDVALGVMGWWLIVYREW